MKRTRAHHDDSMGRSVFDKTAIPPFFKTYIEYYYWNVRSHSNSVSHKGIKIKTMAHNTV